MRTVHRSLHCGHEPPSPPATLADRPMLSGLQLTLVRRSDRVDLELVELAAAGGVRILTAECRDTSELAAAIDVMLSRVAAFGGAAAAAGGKAGGV